MTGAVQPTSPQTFLTADELRTVTAAIMWN